MHSYSPVEDADIYVDYQNTGVNQRKLTANALQSIRITDSDKDMSGSTIFAVKRNDPKDGRPVDIAVAWGQLPSISRPDQYLSLDMGTAIPPFTLVKVAKIVDKAVVNPNEELLYTIRVANVGHKNIAAGQLVVRDVLDPDVTYIARSAMISTTAIADSSSGTPFPLDDTGFTIPVELARRGGTIDITFKVKVAASITTKAKIINRGTLTQVGGGVLPFEASSTVNFAASVKIDNTVYLGQNGGTSCGTAVEFVEGLSGSDITYCYKVTNTGRSHLSSMRITTAELNYTQALTGILAPGAVQNVFVNQKILAALTNNADIVATPVFPNGAVIPDVSDVTSTDPSRVGMVNLRPSIRINNTVYLGIDNGAKCASAVEKVRDIVGSKVVYCFEVVNTGDSHLSGVTIRNTVLNFTRAVTGILAPGQRTLVPLSGSISFDLDNIAEVTGMPVFSNGNAVPGMGAVQSSDPSGVAKLTFNPSIRVENTVYIGNDGGKQCGTPVAVEYVAGIFGINVTYCLKVINNGETHLSNVQLVDPLLKYTDSSIGTLAPGASVMRVVDGKIDVDLKNVATATGNPIMVDGRDIPDLQDVTFSDPSEVDRKNSAPKVDIENTVARGNDPRSCGTSAAMEYVQDFTGSNVTYCFMVKNTGDTFLDSITLSNPTLSFTDTTIPRLAPGVATTVAVRKTITGAFVNTVTVTANPTLGDGTDVPNAADVTDSDTSSIGEILFKPEVKIANTVYIGDNGATSCESSVESVEGLFGTAVTYCFRVTNTGNTHLDSFRIGNDILSFQDQSTIRQLAPNASAIVSAPRKIVSNLNNLARVTARPIKSDGSSLPLPDVSHTDPSSVVRISHKPSIAINNTVYVGTLGSCHRGVDTVSDIFLTDVVYCLRITNNGDTHLNNIVVDDKELSFNQVISRVLAPGESELISLPGKINNNLLNTATVNANPILRDGTDIAGIPDVTSNDWSAVEKPVFTANVKVDNTVYLGNDGGNSCGQSVELVKNLFGSNVTLCFKVTNIGQTHLKSITLSNAVISYTQSLTISLAPGESTTVTVPNTISATRSNMANVTATPVMADGREIRDLGVVKASDPSGVEIVSHAPIVKIDNTVYLGNDGGKSCGTSVEFVKEQFGFPVTYCFKVTNTGNSFLNNIVVTNGDLSYSNSTLGGLGPGSSITVSVQGKISGNITNTAKVTANPCLPDGTDIPNQNDVSSSDPSSIGLVAHKSGINIENTVYLGASDGGAKCSTGVELVQGYPNTAVMYCFAVKNVGESFLKDVVVSNADLTFSDNSIKLLKPGETKLLSLPGTIKVDLTNNAVATGTPALQDGTAIPNSAFVTDTDPSAVDMKDYAPKIVIENSVYPGKDGGKQCGTNVARDLVEGIFGTPVTYCFNVTNVGDTPLTNVAIVNGPLNYNNTTRPLAPGEWVVLPLERTITVDLKNNAVVTATPTIPGLSPVRSEDPSAVDKLDFVGGVKIVNKVYPGTGDNGAKCGTDAAVETVEGIYATPVTYCFTVTNTGDTHLADLVITNTKLTYTKTGFPLLAPGKSTTVSVEGKIMADLINSAVVVGNPVTSTGQDIPDLANVSSEDPSNVRRVNQEATVQIANTVYLGKDGGKQCGTPAAVELTSGQYGSNVTFCFLVTNNGKSFLKDVVVENPILGFADKSITLLAPGTTKMLTMDGAITVSAKNTAVVTGTPSLRDGTVVPDVSKVTASDPSAVERLAHAPRVEIDNLVLLGSDAQKCDTTAAVDFVEHYSGALVTYCFEVTNKGDTHLNNITIVNKELIFKDESIKSLAPGESAIVAFPSKIVDSLKNVAVVTANPILSNGKDIPDTPDVTWSDGSAVGKLEYFPAVKIDNTVYIGDDLGVSCGSKGVEQVVGAKDTTVIYCFNVTNAGDTYLNSVKLVNNDLNFTDNSVGIMAPKSSVLVVFSSTIGGNLTNNVVVTGNPSLEDGADISGAQDVTATDPSHVALNKTTGTVKEDGKDPYSPPNGTQVCLQDKWTSSGKNGTLVCSTKQVFVETVKSTKPLKCKPGEKVNVTVDATMRIDGPRNDLGWYVAADGGDALTGTCIVNGLQSRFGYNLTDTVTTAPAGKIVWLKPDGGDDDKCGDVKTDVDKTQIRTPLLVNAELPCIDDNDDGVLDVAVCFTWKNDINNQGTCNIADNIPGSDCSCYCTRYDIKNVEVEDPPVAPC